MQRQGFPRPVTQPPPPPPYCPLKGHWKHLPYGYNGQKRIKHHHPELWSWEALLVIHYGGWVVLEALIAIYYDGWVCGSPCDAAVLLAALLYHCWLGGMAAAPGARTDPS